MKKRNWILTGLGVLTAIVAAVLLTHCDRREAKSLGIGTFSQAIDYGPVYVARHFRWFEEAVQPFEIDNITYLDLGGFDEIQTALAQNKLHAFFSAEAPVIKLVSEHQPLRIVEVGCTLQQEVLVKKNLGINAISDLKGKSIAVAEGTSSHYGLLSILASAGLAATDVTIRPGFPGEAKPLFETGKVDAWAVWPPFVEDQIIKGHGITLAGGNAKIQSVMSLNTSLMEKHRDLAKVLVATIQRTKTWMRTNPEESITIVAQALHLDRNVVQLAWPKHNWAATLDEDVLADIEAKAVFLKKMGVVASSAPTQTRDMLVDLAYSAK
jgi:sulfonate transport system substrate-binding protein